ncbi:hypothetical protein P4531_06135, partial [Geobacillus stearothermophilus]|uniref:hypothetical protein n=2 Tax=Geobacillus stearothermophilus TaxID=1422 RepID=UPI002E1D85CF|nr:hypothetical protein [Geobacillus stearothermophilus]MED3771843.1 hypothetical protein [Geobacillus stearothermophilus]MED4869729.1 hypothetical protein [Geobacillus stearothermophilus]
MELLSATHIASTLGLPPLMSRTSIRIPFFIKRCPWLFQNMPYFLLQGEISQSMIFIIFGEE